MKNLESMIDLMQHLKAANGDAPLQVSLKNFFDEEDKVINELRVLKVFELILEEINLSIENDEVSMRHMGVVNMARAAFYQSVSAKNLKEFNAKFRTVDRLLLFRMIKDAMLISKTLFSEEIDRPSLKKATEALLKELQAEKMPEYQKSVLIIEIRSILRILGDPDLYSDIDIRYRIKAVFADFCAEFDENDRKYESAREKVGRWARKYVGYGVFALALTADASAVAGLLAAPIDASAAE